jgi:hypothetical protein
VNPGGERAGGVEVAGLHRAEEGAHQSLGAAIRRFVHPAPRDPSALNLTD